MPWNQASKKYPDSGTPAYYSVPAWLYIPDETQLEFAKAQRKHIGQFREELLVYQKACGRNDIEGARFFSAEAAELMKQYRGWDAAIMWIEGSEGMDVWLHSKVAEPIALYVDRAFGLIDLNNQLTRDSGVDNV